MSLIAGSYERFIWGFNLKSLKNCDSFTLAPLFTFPAHLSPIKCAAVSGFAAVTGGADDTIKIYDLSTSSEMGSLLYTSAITSLSFFTPPSLSLSLPRNLIAAAVIIYRPLRPFEDGDVRAQEGRERTRRASFWATGALGGEGRVLGYGEFGERATELLLEAREGSFHC